MKGIKGAIGLIDCETRGDFWGDVVKRELGNERINILNF